MTWKKKKRTPEWVEWRTKVFKRDKYKCQLCKKVGGQIHPHHIISKKLFPHYMFRVMNGITLCYDCHIKQDVHNNKCARKFAKKTRLKLPRARHYHIQRKNDESN